MKIPRGQFEELALQQLDMLYRIARRLTGDRGQAEDLVQETYLRALRAQERFNLEGYGIRPWLLRIMHNLHMSRLQRDGRQPVAVEEEHLEATGADRPEELPIELESFEAMDERLVKALDQLPGEYQAVLLMWAVEGLTYKEIAEALGVPVGTVMSRLYRARQRLMGQLRDLAVEQRIVRE